MHCGMVPADVVVVCLLFLDAVTGQQSNDASSAIEQELHKFSRAGFQSDSSNGAVAGALATLAPYRTEDVEFISQGTTVRGKLFTPMSTGAAFPAVTVVGPVMYIKEQAPTQYATRLAQRGFVTLIFDARNFGDSDGEPRYFESLSGKMQDVLASIDFLQRQPQVNGSRIGGLGICQGANVMISAAGQDSRIKALSTVAGNYITRKNAERMYGGDPAVLDARLARADDAKRRFEQSGQVDYGLVIQPSEGTNRKDPLLIFKEPWLFYHQWLPHTNWKNQYTIMSESETWRYDVLETAKDVTQPFLLVYSAGADGGAPQFANQMFDNLKSRDKSKAWLGDAGHIEFYENAIVIDQAIEALSKFYGRVL